MIGVDFAKILFDNGVEMNILQVTSGYYPAIGGLEQHVQMISEGMVALGHTVSVATLSYQPNLPATEEVNGVRVFRYRAKGLDGFGYPVGMLDDLKHMQRDIDVVHAHNYGGLPLLFAVSVFKEKTILSPHYHGHTNLLFNEVLHSVYDPLVNKKIKKRPLCYLQLYRRGSHRYKKPKVFE